MPQYRHRTESREDFMFRTVSYGGTHLAPK